MAVVRRGEGHFLRQQTGGIWTERGADVRQAGTTASLTVSTPGTRQSRGISSKHQKEGSRILDVGMSCHKG